MWCRGMKVFAPLRRRRWASSLHAAATIGQTKISDAVKIPDQRSHTVSEAVVASLRFDIAALQAQQEAQDADIAADISRVCMLGVTSLNSGGRILTTGMGKSGHVAHRLASSLASLGLDAMYVSASDWGHGHLGYARKGDVGVVFSHSGMSVECVHAALRLRERGVAVCGVVGNRTHHHDNDDTDNSSSSGSGGGGGGLNADDIQASSVTPLCRQCDETISYCLGGASEPFGMVPTSSVVIQESISNAIIHAMIAANDLSKESFLRNHPSNTQDI